MAKISAQEKEATRSNIISASRDVFREYGYQKTQIKTIAKKAGVGVSTIYGYYPSKLDLFVYSFLDLNAGIDVTEEFMKECLEEGLSVGLCKLLLETRHKDFLTDRELLRTFYIASISDLFQNARLKKELTDHSQDLKMIGQILELYERTNKRLCAFSMKVLIECVFTITQQIGIDFLLYDDITYDEIKIRLIEELSVLFAGKYENV